MLLIPAGGNKYIRIAVVFMFTAAITGLFLINGTLSHDVLGSKVQESNKMEVKCKIGGERWNYDDDNDVNNDVNKEVACILAACMGDYNCLSEFHDRNLVTLLTTNQNYEDYLEFSSTTDSTMQQVDQNNCVESSIANINSSGSDSKEAHEAIDANYNTKWTEHGYGSFLQVDLGSPKQVCSIDVAWYNGDEKIYNFIISTSNNGSTFTDVLRGVSTGVTRAPENYDLLSSSDDDDDNNAQFVRITVFGNTDSKNSDKASSEASISEIKVFADNLGASSQ